MVICPHIFDLSRWCAAGYKLPLASLGLYAQFIAQLAFIPIFRALLRSLKCSQIEGLSVVQGDSPLDSPWRWDINPSPADRGVAYRVDPTAGYDGAVLSESGGFPWSADPLSDMRSNTTGGGGRGGADGEAGLWQACWVGEHRFVGGVGLLAMLVYIPLSCES